VLLRIHQRVLLNIGWLDGSPFALWRRASPCSHRGSSTLFRLFVCNLRLASPGGAGEDERARASRRGGPLIVGQGAPGPPGGCYRRQVPNDDHSTAVAAVDATALTGAGVIAAVLGEKGHKAGKMNSSFLLLWRDPTVVVVATLLKGRRTLAWPSCRTLSPSPRSGKAGPPFLLVSLPEGGVRSQKDPRREEGTCRKGGGRRRRRLPRVRKARGCFLAVAFALRSIKRSTLSNSERGAFQQHRRPLLSHGLEAPAALLPSSAASEPRLSTRTELARA